MKFLPLILALSFAWNGPVWAQSGDLKSESESSSGNDSEGSMNSLWSEETKPAGATDKGSVATPSVSAAAGAETTITDVSGLCSINAFQSSELVNSSAWPGLGPFNSADNNQYVDPHQNKLKLFLDGEHISACELFIASGTANHNFLNIEMVCDFMLEALGAKGSKIADFNSYLEKNQEALGGAIAGPRTAKSTAPVIAAYVAKYSTLSLTQLYQAARAYEAHTYKISADEYENLIRVYQEKLAKKSGANTVQEGLKTTAGAYAVALFPAAQGPGTLLIQMTSKNGKISKAESIAFARTANQTEPDGETNTDISAETNTDTNTDNTASVPAKTTVAVANAANKPPVKTTKPPVKNVVPQVKPEKPEKIEDTESDALKSELRDVIRNWQTVKKAAVKSRDTSALGTILSGNALKRQQDSIKWLVDNKQHYELTPKSVIVEKYEAIPGSVKKYAVFTVVKELTKVMKDGVAGAAKETDDTYSVKYTIERTGDHWSIADSLLLVKKK